MQFRTKAGFICAGAALLAFLTSVQYSEGQYCADCGATRGMSQWRILGVPIWTTHGAAHANVLSEYMQYHGWPSEHTEWRAVDALDYNPVLGTGFYGGSHFRRLTLQDIDRGRLDQATDSFAYLPTTIDLLVLKATHEISSEHLELQMLLIRFLEGTSDWEELEREGIVSQFLEIARHRISDDQR
jgi:hypothetical protein